MYKKLVIHVFQLFKNDRTYDSWYTNTTSLVEFTTFFYSLGFVNSKENKLS